MKAVLGSIGAAWLLLTAVASGGDTNTITAVLREADKARGNLGGVEWEVHITSVERGRTSNLDFNVRARGFDVFALTTAPARNKGNKLLMVKGNMWFHKPDISKPVPISQRQRLLGNAAYGDIAATNYAEDYDATALPDEHVDGEPCYVFDLRARSKETTYDRIQYWISRRRVVGVKADYYTVSGKRFKTAAMAYGNRVDAEGETNRLFISRMEIRDVLMDDSVTTMEFADPRLRELPPRVFDLNQMVQ